MPNEPEQTIEQVLHAYAHKRQAEAGAPLELHPATRQLLQGEVARTLAKPVNEAPSRFQFLLAAWPRLAFGGAIFATLVFVMVLLQSGNRVGPDGSLMELAQHKATPAGELERRKYSEPSAPAVPEAKDRDDATPMPEARKFAQPPPKPAATDPVESIKEAKVDSYARPTPPPAAPMPRSFKPAEPATRTREEMTRQNFSFKAKSETAEAKAIKTPAAPAIAADGDNAKGLGRESSVNRQAGEKQMAETRPLLRDLAEQPAKPADKSAPAAKPPLRMMRTAEPSRSIVADEKSAKEPAPTAAPAGAAAETGKFKKLADRDVKLGADKSATMLAVTPAKRLAYDSISAATNAVFFYNAGGDLRLSFAQEDSRARYRQNLNSPAVPNVLTTFQIERVGNAIRIIDADGSTYKGQIISGEANGIAAYSNVETRANSVKGNIAARGTPALAGRAGNAQAAGFSFQAVGTNQTLNQSVEFFGTMALDPPLAQTNDTSTLALMKAKTAAPAPTNGPQTNEVQNQAMTPRGKIQGRAVVGGKNQFEIIAVPAVK